MRCIVAASKNNGIGVNGILPWAHLKYDMVYFKACTIGGVVIMGRKTWESIGSTALPNRQNIVISKSLTGNYVFKSLNDALQSVKNTRREIWIIGGGQLYLEAFKHKDT